VGITFSDPSISTGAATILVTASDGSSSSEKATFRTFREESILEPGRIVARRLPDGKARRKPNQWPLALFHAPVVLENSDFTDQMIEFDLNVIARRNIDAGTLHAILVLYTIRPHRTHTLNP
jgi:hypothetical protein